MNFRITSLVLVATAMEAQGATTSQMFLRAKAMVEGKQTRSQQVTLQTCTAITGFRVEKQDEKACQSDLR